MRKLLLNHGLCPGDVAIVTMALESLHRQFPGKFLTNMQTNHNELFANNPWVTPMSAAECEYIDMRYDRINESHIPFHFGSAFCDHLGDILGLPLRLQVSRPHFYLSAAEKTFSVFNEKTGEYGPYAIINAGYKDDYPAKWAGTELYQSVVDTYKDRIRFVQVGAAKDNHPPLHDTINLIGQTTLRELLRLCHGATFGIGGITALGHFMAGFSKPYICMIGGREPISWIGYPTQISLSTQGLLPCCKSNGCWKSIVVGGESDRKCALPVVDQYHSNIPMCMAMLKTAAIDAAGAILDIAEMPSEITADRSLVDPGRLKVIQDSVIATANLPGDMVECGCYRGGTAKLISYAAPNKTLYMFDGFEMGIPEDDQEPAGHKQGEFASNLSEVTEFLAGCKVSIHPGRFPDTAKDLDNLTFSFAHLDFDTYQSTRDALLWVWPKMVENGVVILDDYNWGRCPGVKRAVNEILPEVPVQVTHGMQAMLRKGQNRGHRLLKELVVYECPVLKKRIGSKNDGGYVVPDLDIQNVDYLISAGIGNNSDFEKEFAKLSRAKIKMFDSKAIPEEIPAGAEFFPIGIGVDGHSIQTMLDHSKTANGKRMWLKIDIENSEWETLRITDPKILSRFEVIMIELHGIMNKKNMNDKIRYLQTINNRFKLVHAHPNNCGGYGWIGDTMTPDTIEATYMRKDLAEKWNFNSEVFPSEHDAHCCPQSDVITLAGWPWVTPSST
jgi:hypothetical protein